MSEWVEEIVTKARKYRLRQLLVLKDTTSREIRILSADQMRQVSHSVGDFEKAKKLADDLTTAGMPAQAYEVAAGRNRERLSMEVPE